MFHESPSTSTSKLKFVRPCSRCGKQLEDHRKGKQTFCLECHAKYMRENRPRHLELTQEQRDKANARSYANSYLRRGKIKKDNCRDCESEKSQMHHEDYSKPLEVIWLCRECHLKLHKDAA